MIAEQKNSYMVVGESELRLQIAYKDNEFEQAKMDFYGIGTGVWHGANSHSQTELEKSLDEITTYALDALVFVQQARKESREIQAKHNSQLTKEGGTNVKK